MVKVWRHFSHSRRRQECAFSALTTSEVFRGLVQKERARADRSGSPFSLVAFDVGTTRPGNTLAGLLLDALCQRKRITDEAGCSDDRHVAAILPSTTAAGARRFAEDVSRIIARTRVPPPYHIHQYPLEPIDGDGRPTSDALASLQSNGSDRSPTGAAPRPVSHCDKPGCRVAALLRQPLPAWKRAADVLLSAILLVCLFPLFLLIAVLIQMVSPGPVFFTQKRAGHMGREFSIWKFRTMRVDADPVVHRNQVIQEISSDGPLTKLDSSHDPRVIPLGKWLRLTGLDELPQLFNVLRGDMSLVGPRPDPVYAAARYQPWHTARLNVVPGITGLWQVSGKNRTTFKQMIRLDIVYSRRASAWLDLKIIIKTLPSILSQIRDNASNGIGGIPSPPSHPGYTPPFG